MDRRGGSRYEEEASRLFDGDALSESVRKLGSLRITRRELIGSGLAAGAALLLSDCGHSVVHKAAETCPSGASLTDVEHVVVLMIENRSFDHFFGVYPGVRGFDDHPSGDLGVFAQSWPTALGGPSSQRMLPYHLDTLDPALKASIIGNVDVPDHDWRPQHLSWAKGKMTEFVATHSLFDGREAAPLVMGYYERSDLPFWYALADAFTICDNYFCSVIGPTMPNRLYAMSGTIDPSGAKGGPIVSTPGITGPDASKNFLFTCSWTTMFERLESRGVSWKVYQQPGSSVGSLESLNLGIGFNALLYFKQYQDPSSELYKKAFLPSWPSDFESDVSSGNLPEVSWLIPPIVTSVHPPAPPELGAWMIARVLDSLSSNPKVWAKTALFITFDENGGFFDHVPPPTAPPGTPGEYLTASPLPKEAYGISGPIGLGFRVPMLVCSPFSRGGWINSDTFDHTSILRFLEARFGVEVPNLSSWRRSTVGDLTTTLDFSHADTALPRLPSAPLENPRLVAQFPEGVSLLKTASPLDPITGKSLEAIVPFAYQHPVVPPPPAIQEMPSQEPGIRKTRAIAPCPPLRPSSRSHK